MNVEKGLQAAQLQDTNLPGCGAAQQAQHKTRAGQIPRVCGHTARVAGAQTTASCLQLKCERLNEHDERANIYSDELE